MSGRVIARVRERETAAKERRRACRADDYREALQLLENVVTAAVIMSAIQARRKPWWRRIV